MKVLFGLIAIIIIGAILYVIVYQAMNHANFKNLFAWNPFKVSNGVIQVGAPSTKTPAGVPSDSPLYQPLDKSKVTPPVGFTEDQLSPYYQQIAVSSVRPSGNNDDSNELSLQPSWSVNLGINVTGWRIKTNKGEAKIPNAVSDYVPWAAPVYQDIVLEKGGTLTVYGFYNTVIRYYNLRLNKCTGYLNSLEGYIPNLPNNCPNFTRSDVFQLSGQCQNFLTNLSSCRVPTASEVNALSGPDNNCHSLLLQVNYKGCYDRFRRDLNFFSNEWRTWLTQKLPLDPDHDRVLLLDKEGLVVNEYIY
jgi:hypothetical protein